MSGRVTVRLAGAEDLEAIVAVERGAVEAPHWGIEVYRAALAVRDGGAGVERRVLVAEVLEAELEDSGGMSPKRRRVVGFVVGRASEEEVKGEIESVAVALAWRRRGIAGALCGGLLGWFRERGVTRVELEVRAGSAGARALYAQLGFVEQGVRRRYYAQPEDDAVLMELALEAFASRGAV